MHYDHFKPKSYLKLIKKYVFSEGEQFLLRIVSYILNIAAYLTAKPSRAHRTVEPKNINISLDEMTLLAVYLPALRLFTFAVTQFAVSKAEISAPGMSEWYYYKCGTNTTNDAYLKRGKY